MPNADAATQGAETKPAGNSVSVLPVILSVFLAVLLAAGALGGGVWWLVHSGRIALGAPTAPKAEPEKAAKPLVHEVTLDPLLVNLSDPDGHSYLRVGLTFAVEDAPPVKGEKPTEEKPEKGKAIVPEHNAEMRDVALDVIGRTSAAQLLATDGKELLKQQLRTALQQRVPDLKVTDLYFTEFLVQR